MSRNKNKKAAKQPPARIAPLVPSPTGGPASQPVVPAAPAEPTLEHVFNDDLLMSAGDREWALSQFGDVYHVLDHQELRDEFARYEKLANRSKSKVHAAGFVAIGLATLALLSSALTPLLKIIEGVPEWLHAVCLGAEVAGLLGAGIAAGGLVLAGQKKDWLEARMMAEILRLWHFQSLICRGVDIDRSIEDSAPKAHETFADNRSKLFKAFLHEWTGKLDNHLADLVNNAESGYQLLHEETEYAANSVALSRIFVVYRQLRFKHQAGYAEYKLQKTTHKPLWRPLSWPSGVLQRRSESITSFCLIASLIVSLLIVFGNVFGWAFAHHAALPGLIISLMIINVAARAIQDGLAAPKEVQRYSDYHGKIRYLLTRFEASKDAPEKLRLMKEMERAALEELKSFLRAHHEARFIV